LCQAGWDAEAEAETLPFARHHDLAPMTSPTRVASHSTDRSQIRSAHQSGLLQPLLVK